MKVNQHVRYQAIIPAPFGAVGVIMQSGQLLGIDLLSEHHHIRPELLQAHADAATQQVCEQIARYLHNPHARMNIQALVQGTPYQQRVWAAISAIPMGKTLTYTELAKMIGSGPRAVANACGANKLPLLIPCHRVVAKHGLGGFMQGKLQDSLAVKRWLLRHENAL